MKLNRAQYILLNELDTKFMAYIGGFGSGKTFTGCLDLILFLARHPGQTVGYFGTTYPSIRDIFYPTFSEAAEMLGFTTNAYVANKEVQLLKNGKVYGTVICRSLDNPNSIVGYKIARALVDEIDTLPHTKALAGWQKLIARLRLAVDGEENKVIVTTTPEGYGFVYNMFANEPTESYSMVQASTYENAEFLPDGYIESLIETYPEQLIQAYLNGEFVNLESGSVYSSYNRVEHNSSEVVEPNDVLYIGMDFNIDNMAATIFVKRDKAFHAVDEISGEHNTVSTCELIRRRYPNNKAIVYPDSSGKNRTSASVNSASESDIAIIQDRKYSFTTRFKSQNPRVKDRIQAMNAAFEKGLLFVNADRCPNVAMCLEQQCYNDKGEPDKTSGKDHQNDATGYVIAYEMPLKKPVRQMNIQFRA